MDKLQYKIEQCAVCDYTFPEQTAEITCPRCGTRYDLINRKIDNSDTMISISECKHRNRLFVAGSRWSGPDWNGHYDVMLCADCGQFTVLGSENGTHYKFSFDLATDEQVTAAGKYARLLDAEMKGEWKLGQGRQSTNGT